MSQGGQKEVVARNEKSRSPCGEPQNEAHRVAGAGLDAAQAVLRGH
jgi:hypothetical protein